MNIKPYTSTTQNSMLLLAVSPSVPILFGSLFIAIGRLLDNNHNDYIIGGLISFIISTLYCWVIYRLVTAKVEITFAENSLLIKYINPPLFEIQKNIKIPYDLIDKLRIDKTTSGGSMIKFYYSNKSFKLNIGNRKRDKINYENFLSNLLTIANHFEVRILNEWSDLMDQFWKTMIIKTIKVVSVVIIYFLWFFIILYYQNNQMLKW